MLDEVSKAIAVQFLDYNETTWDLPGTADVEIFDFSSLDAYRQKAILSLGFTADQWDCYVNHYGFYSWDELQDLGVQNYFIVLGWTEKEWLGDESIPQIQYLLSETELAALLEEAKYGDNERPGSDYLWWDELTSYQREAAIKLCYFEETWNRKPKIPEWPYDFVTTSAEKDPIRPSVTVAAIAALVMSYLLN